MSKSNRPFLLVPYDQTWPQRFEVIAKDIKHCFGSNLIDVEHIGSTSIVGMTAKPQIDVLAVVSDLSQVKLAYRDMEKLGYLPKGNYVKIDGEYFTKDNEDGMRLASIHVLEKGHPEIVPILSFRDYLRRNETDRNLYLETKKKLYEQNKDNYPAYDSGKKDVINQIRNRALIWNNEN